MAQFGTADIPVGSGTYSGTQWGNHNNALVAHVLSQGIGPTRPSRAQKGMIWAQQGSGVINIRCFDGANDILIGTVNESTNEFTLAGLIETNNRFQLPGGTFAQWLNVGPIGSGSSVTVSWPTAFPSACRVVTSAYVNSGGDPAAESVYVAQIKTITASQVTVRNLGPSGAQYFILGIGN